MKSIHVLRGVVVAVALAALGACDRSSTAPSTDPREDLARRVEALGLRGDMVQDFGDYVIVEGDIRFTKAELLAVPLLPRGVRGPRFQYNTTALVGSPKVHQITVDVSGLASQSGWQTAARDALTLWSGISNSYVQLVEGSPADITVTTTCTSSNVAAYASFPSSGNPGSTIYVNTCFGYSTTQSQKLHNMVHEFGHTLGFRHSNYTQLGESAGTDGAVQISGTPTSGNATGSVMNGGTALNSWAGFSASDQLATRTLYPLPVPSLTVTYVSGQPVLTWPSLVGATYVVERVYASYGVDEFGSFTAYGHAGTFTNVTSPWTDTGWSYTGNSTCHWDQESGYWLEASYGYSLEAHFPTGTTSTSEAAEVGDC